MEGNSSGQKTVSSAMTQDPVNWRETTSAIRGTAAHCTLSRLGFHCDSFPFDFEMAERSREAVVEMYVVGGVVAVVVVVVGGGDVAVVVAVAAVGGDVAADVDVVVAAAVAVVEDVDTMNTEFVGKDQVAILRPGFQQPNPCCRRMCLDPPHPMAFPMARETEGLLNPAVNPCYWKLGCGLRLAPAQNGRC